MKSVTSVYFFLHKCRILSEISSKTMIEMSRANSEISFGILPDFVFALIMRKSFDGLHRQLVHESQMLLIDRRECSVYQHGRDLSGLRTRITLQVSSRANRLNGAE
jgi:hypothetical protein